MQILLWLQAAPNVLKKMFLRKKNDLTTLFFLFVNLHFECTLGSKHKLCLQKYQLDSNPFFILH